MRFWDKVLRDAEKMLDAPGTTEGFLLRVLSGVFLGAGIGTEHWVLGVITFLILAVSSVYIDVLKWDKNDII